MSHQLTVFVVHKDGRPLRKGMTVRIWIGGIMDGGSIEAYTDETGHAYLQTVDDYPQSRQIWISVPWFGVEFSGPYSIGAGAYTVRLPE